MALWKMYQLYLFLQRYEDELDEEFNEKEYDDVIKLTKLLDELT